jgi:FAD/FMN-containing dehydrogenase
VLQPDLETSETSNPSTSHTAYPIEPEHPFVYVTFGAGATQRNVDAYTNANPYQGTSASGQTVDVPYYVPWAAHPVGSTVMMLGGFGFLSRLHGLSLDIVVEVEMVLADGRIVIVSETENSDLWWGIRGAGTAFGIATRYKAKAFPVPVVYAGNIIYEFRPSTAPSLVKHFRDCIKSAPRELYANLILTAGPRHNGALVVIQLCYIGTRERGAEFLQAILSWDGGSCLLNEVNEKTFWNQQDSVAKVLKAAAGRKWFIRSDLVTSLTDDVIHATVTKFASTPDGCAWLFELGGGAIVDFEDTCLPLVSRQASFNIVAFHQWKIDEYDDRCVDSVEEWMVETIAKHSPGGPLPCFFERRERVTRTMATYGDENWHKLCLLKRKYDPSGLIKHCFWPLDEEGRPLGLDEDMVDVQTKTEEDGAGTADGAKGRTLDEAPGASKDTGLVDGDAGDEASDDKGKGKVKKGKGKEDLRTGNHFMDRLLLP